MEKPTPRSLNVAGAEYAQAPPGSGVGYARRFTRNPFPPGVIERLEFNRDDGLTLHTHMAEAMRNYTPRDNAKITAGAVAALVMVAWFAILALTFLAMG